MRVHFRIGQIATALFFVLAFVGVSLGQHAAFDPGLQYAENPPMVVNTRVPPEPAKATEKFEVRKGFRVIESLDEFRKAIKMSGQKVRMKPGIYRAKKADEPTEFPLKGADRKRYGKMEVVKQEHIFAVNGSNNSFDLRGVVIETPVSVQSKLTGRTHVSDCWHVNGNENIFIGGYFRNVIDPVWLYGFLWEGGGEFWKAQ